MTLDAKLTIRRMICGHFSSDTVVDHPVGTHLQPFSEFVVRIRVVDNSVNLDNRVVDAVHLWVEVALKAMRVWVLGFEEGEWAIFDTSVFPYAVTAMA